MPDNSRYGSTNIFLLHALYLVSGTATVLIGPLLPILARRFELGDMETGAFFPAQFAGSLTGTIMASRFGRRDRYFEAAWIGGVAMAAGVLLLSLNSRVGVVFGFFILGIGIGLTLPAINMLIVERAGENAGSALSVLNLCWGIGAIVCQPFVKLSVVDVSTQTVSWVIGSILLVISVPLLVMRPTATDPRDVESKTVETSRRVWTTVPIILIAAFNFVHVGFETSVGGWLAAYTERISDGDFGIFSPVLVYFVMFVAGRAFTPIILRVLKESILIPTGLLTMLAGVVVLLFAETVGQLAIGAACAGVGTSWIFPLNIARLQRFTVDHDRVDATPFFLMGTLGAAVSTYSIGFISDAAGDLRIGMVVLLISVFGLLAIEAALTLYRRYRRII